MDLGVLGQGDKRGKNWYLHGSPKIGKMTKRVQNAIKKGQIGLNVRFFSGVWKPFIA
jgi:hypothetical protein